MTFSFILVLILFIFLFYLEKYVIVEGFEPYLYTAIIVEPREHAALEFVLKNFQENLPKEWQFVVFHGNKNIEYTREICDRVFEPGRVKMVNLGVDNLDWGGYIELFRDDLLYSNIPTEIFLVFQTDAIICSQFKEKLNEFLSYDYVGAPWLNGTVGNGGLSLRRKSKMLEILEKCKITKDANDKYIGEDAYFSFACEGVEMNKPTAEHAKNFSIETVHHDKSFGIHNAFRYLNNDQLNEIGEWCPDIHELRRLNDIK